MNNRRTPPGNSGRKPAARRSYTKSTGPDKGSKSSGGTGRSPSKRTYLPKDADGKPRRPRIENKPSDERNSRGPRKTYGQSDSRPDSRKPRTDKRSFGGPDERSSSRSPRKPYGSSSDRPDSRKPRTDKRSFGGSDDRSASRGPRKPYGSSSDRPDSRKPRTDKRSFGGPDERSSSRSPRKPYGSSDTRPDSRRPRTDKKPYGTGRANDAPRGRRPEKKAFGGADTYQERKDQPSVRSFGTSEESQDKTPRRELKRTAPTTTQFTKKSEMKGYKPRITTGDETDFRFLKPGSRGKTLDLGQEEKKATKRKTEPKERVTENALKAGESVRLNRFISNAGVCSRREADELIAAGLVSINSTIVTELGTKVNAGDVVRFNGEKLAVEEKVYIVLNKPKDAITTADDPEGRNTVMDLFQGKLRERIFPVGRLDRNTTGVILLTNDGELANRLMHPKYEVKKVYRATLNKQLKPADLWTLSNGVELEDGFIKPDAMATPDPKDKATVGIEIHSGRNRIIHRMFEHLGYVVDRLDRVLYAGLEKGKLKRGEWRELNEKELKTLKKSIHLK